MKKDKNDYKLPTIVVIFISVVGIIAYDIIPAISQPYGDTISEVLREWSYRFWVIPLAFGVLCGHWFGPRLDPVENGFIFLIMFGIVSLAMGFLGIGQFDASNFWMLTFLGFLMGALFWGQPHI